MKQSASSCFFMVTGLAFVGLTVLHLPHPRGILAQQGSSTAIADFPAAQEDVPAIAPARLCKTESHLFASTELFFGLRKPNGSEVTETEFQQFLSREVTPRFPDGLTLLTGQGQFKNSSGQIVKEPTKLLILLYPLEPFRNNNQKIQQIRQSYKTQFQQESVLRTDELSCVSF